MGTAKVTLPRLDDAAARRRDLAVIHIGCKALGWSTDDYRHILRTVCQVQSSADLDFAGRKRFLEHMRKCGWSSGQDKAKRPAWTPKQRLMWSLWQQLADAGLVAERSREALQNWVKRHAPTAVDRIEWLNDPHQLDLVIAMLKQWLKRAGDRP